MTKESSSLSLVTSVAVFHPSPPTLQTCSLFSWQSTHVIGVEPQRHLKVATPLSLSSILGGIQQAVCTY